MYRDLTKGRIIRGLLLFALPMIAGNLLQQLYNIADTLIVGQALGRNALAAVGSAYTLMTFLTSIFLGLSMGSGALFSIALGKKDDALLRSAVGHAFGLILAVTVVLNVLVYAFLDAILRFLQIPQELYGQMREYLVIIFAGLLATFLYNFFACLLRAAGNSVAPLCFLGLSAGLNIALDLLFVLRFGWGIAGAAAATVFSQYVSGIGLTVYTALRCRGLLPDVRSLRFDRQVLADILDMSLLTCAQQSAMNFGILLVQRLVDSFGPVTMAAFAAAVKIDSFAYLPVQDFGNAFSTFVAQNYGAGQRQRIRRGFRDATLVSAGVIQIGLFTALNELCRWSYWPCYLIALVASVVWNFTLNRKFTFQSANNVPKAMAMVLGYYAVFTPLSTILGNWLVESCGWNEYLVTVMNMLLNFVTEYLFDTFVVFRGSMDTNEAAKKKAAQ